MYTRLGFPSRIPPAKAVFSEEDLTFFRLMLIRESFSLIMISATHCKRSELSIRELKSQFALDLMQGISQFSEFTMLLEEPFLIYFI